MAAQDGYPTQQRPSGWQCQWCPQPEAQSGSVTAGIGYVSDRSYKFGEYRGLEDEGAYAIGEADARFRDDEGREVSVTADRLGLATRSVDVEAALRRGP